MDFNTTILVEYPPPSKKVFYIDTGTNEGSDPALQVNQTLVIANRINDLGFSIGQYLDVYLDNGGCLFFFFPFTKPFPHCHINCIILSHTYIKDNTMNIIGVDASMNQCLLCIPFFQFKEVVQQNKQHKTFKYLLSCCYSSVFLLSLFIFLFYCYNYYFFRYGCTSSPTAVR